MLTESERQWLEHRDAMQFLTGTYIADFAEFPLWNNGKDWQDAAEFSERVAAKLANIHFGTEFCEYCSSHVRVYEYCGECHTADDSKHCQDCRLKAARLQVEEEMDGKV